MPGTGILSEKRYENLLFLSLKVDGKEITAYVDTDAGLTFFKESFANLLGISKESEAKGGNNQGEVLPFSMGVLKEFDFLGFKIPDLSVGILPDKALVFPEDAYGNIFPGDMILGYDVQSQFSLDLYLKHRKITVSRTGMLKVGIPLLEGPLPVFHGEVDGK